MQQASLFLIEQSQGIDYLCKHRKHFLEVNTQNLSRLEAIKMTLFETQIAKKHGIKPSMQSSEFETNDRETKGRASIMVTIKKNNHKKKAESQSFITTFLSYYNIQNQTVINIDRFSIELLNKASGDQFSLRNMKLLSTPPLKFRDQGTKIQILGISYFHNSLFFQLQEKKLINYKIKAQVVGINKQFYRNVVMERFDLFRYHSQVVFDKRPVFFKQERSHYYDVGLENKHHMVVISQGINQSILNILQEKKANITVIKNIIFQPPSKGIVFLCKAKFVEQNPQILSHRIISLYKICQDNSNQASLSDTNLSTMFLEKA